MTTARQFQSICRRAFRNAHEAARAPAAKVAADQSKVGTSMVRGWRERVQGRIELLACRGMDGEGEEEQAVSERRWRARERGGGRPAHVQEMSDRHAWRVMRPQHRCGAAQPSHMPLHSFSCESRTAACQIFMGEHL